MRTITDAMCKEIDELLSNGATIKKVRAYLTMEDISDKEANAYIKELGLVGTKQGFKADYYDFLSAEARTEEEILSYIKENGTDNIIKNTSNFLNIGRLAARIWAQKDTGPAESEGEKKAWDQYNKVKAEFEAGKNPKATRVHPDKVSKFNNDKLTDAYTSLFQEINR